MIDKTYVLITAARNEERYIEKTILSVLSQTVLPKKWVILSDNSIDDTDKIIKKYKKLHNFIEFIKIRSNEQRNFSSKVNALKKGYERLKLHKFDYIGNLDADISFNPFYYEEIINRLEHDIHLGITGGIVLELINNKLREQKISMNSVAGAVQFFRRSCFEKIGGYIPLKLGGEDAAAEIKSRMYGWKVQTYTDIKVIHNRPIIQGKMGLLKTRIRQGMMFFQLGYLPLFETLRCISRITERPYIVGSGFELSSYFLSYLFGKKIQLSKEVVYYLRTEQKNRIAELLKPTNK
jgi:glycosyltransferase involved in cell wall biosynthesis